MNRFILALLNTKHACQNGVFSTCPHNVFADTCTVVARLLGRSAQLRNVLEMCYKSVIWNLFFVKREFRPYIVRLGTTPIKAEEIAWSAEIDAGDDELVRQLDMCSLAIRSGDKVFAAVASARACEAWCDARLKVSDQKD